VADAQHLDGFSIRSPMRAIPSYEPVEVIQLSRINGGVFSERHVGQVCLLVHVAP